MVVQINESLTDPVTLLALARRGHGELLRGLVPLYIADRSVELDPLAHTSFFDTAY